MKAVSTDVLRELLPGDENELLVKAYDLLQNESLTTRMTGIRNLLFNLYDDSTRHAPAIIRATIKSLDPEQHAAFLKLIEGSVHNAADDNRNAILKALTGLSFLDDDLSRPSYSDSQCLEFGRLLSHGAELTIDTLTLYMHTKEGPFRAKLSKDLGSFVAVRPNELVRIVASITATDARADEEEFLYTFINEAGHKLFENCHITAKLTFMENVKNSDLRRMFQKT